MTADNTARKFDVSEETESGKESYTSTNLGDFKRKAAEVRQNRPGVSGQEQSAEAAPRADAEKELLDELRGMAGKNKLAKAYTIAKDFILDRGIEHYVRAIAGQNSEIEKLREEGLSYLRAERKSASATLREITGERRKIERQLKIEEALEPEYLSHLTEIREARAAVYDKGFEELDTLIAKYELLIQHTADVDVGVLQDKIDEHLEEIEVELEDGQIDNEHSIEYCEEELDRLLESESAMELVVSFVKAQVSEYSAKFADIRKKVPDYRVIEAVGGKAVERSDSCKELAKEQYSRSGEPLVSYLDNTMERMGESSAIQPKDSGIIEGQEEKTYDSLTSFIAQAEINRQERRRARNQRRMERSDPKYSS